MSSPSAAQVALTPIYQCDANDHRALRSVGEKLHRLCSQHANRLAKIETMDGDVFEGHILHCDRGILYVCLSNEGYARGFFPAPPFPNPYYNNVLPLVLFNLLAISLL